MSDTLTRLRAESSDEPVWYSCPHEYCTSTVEWFHDDTATWCECCTWSGWGEELRLGRPGSLTGIM